MKKYWPTVDPLIEEMLMMPEETSSESGLLILHYYWNVLGMEEHTYIFNTKAITAAYYL